MSKDRTTSTDALETLGTIITDGGRDAIHLAFEPVEAGERLVAGQHIGLSKDGRAYHNTDAYYAHCKKHVGIVDPFLTSPVEIGQKFWLIVYPRQITSLRHVWSHPDFKESNPKEKDDKQRSIEWMQNWANEHMGSDCYGDDDRLSNEQAYANAIEAGHNNQPRSL